VVRLPAEQRRLQLLEVARDKFSAQGFHATSMDEIAEAAGVTKPVLYQHFPSKHALYVELLEDTGRLLLTTLAETTAGAATGRERVELGFRAYFRFAVEHREAFLLLLGTVIRADAEFARVVDETLDACAEVISTLIEIPVSSEQRLVLATAMVGMAEAVSRGTLAETTDDAHADALARWVSELAWFGLRGVRAESDVAPRGD
jgi:AcrR family transcriptional regulator